MIATVRQRLKSWRRASAAWKRAAFRMRDLLALANAEFDAYKAKHDHCIDEIQEGFDKTIEEALDRAEKAEAERDALKAAALKLDLYVDFSHEAKPSEQQFAPRDPAEMNAAYLALHTLIHEAKS